MSKNYELKEIELYEMMRSSEKKIQDYLSFVFVPIKTYLDDIPLNK